MGWWNKWTVFSHLFTEAWHSLLTFSSLRNKFFRIPPGLHKPLHDVHMNANMQHADSTKLTVCIQNKQPGREERKGGLTLAHIFSGELWLLFFSFCFFWAFRAACKSAGFNPVCKHINNSSNSALNFIFLSWFAENLSWIPSLTVHKVSLMIIYT